MVGRLSGNKQLLRSIAFVQAAPTLVGNSGRTGILILQFRLFFWLRIGSSVEKKFVQDIFKTGVNVSPEQDPTPGFIYSGLRCKDIWFALNIDHLSTRLSNTY